MILLAIQTAFDGDRLATRWQTTPEAANALIVPLGKGLSISPLDPEESNALEPLLEEQIETVLVQIWATFRRFFRQQEQLSLFDSRVLFHQVDGGVAP